MKRPIFAAKALLCALSCLNFANATVDPRQITIDFDDIAAPPTFGQTVRLTNTYTPQGVTFSGEVAESGMAVLDSTGFFNVSGQSLPNVLIANPTQLLADFGIPRTPETLTFNPPIHSFSIRAMSPSPGADLHIYFAISTPEGGSGATPFQLGNTFNTYTFTGDEITSIQIDTDAPVLVLDDLTFIPGPSNDQCGNAKVITPGTWFGKTSAATNDGNTNCGVSNTAKDVWFSYTPAQSGRMRLSTFGSNYDTLLSLHSACPGTPDNALACNDDAPIGSADGGGTTQSELTYDVVSGATYLIRVTGYGSQSGSYALNLIMPDDRPDAECGVVAAFPSAQSTIVALPLLPFTSPTEIIYFASASNGDSVTQLVHSDQLHMDHMELDFKVPSNSLSSTLAWGVKLNGTTVGVFSIAVGFTGAVHQEYDFPDIAGPNYTVRMEVLNEVASGATTFGYSGADSGYVKLTSKTTKLTANDSDRGFWTSTGDHTATIDTTFVGHDMSLKGYNGFFIFDTGILTSVKQATFRLEIESYVSTDPSETIGIFDIGTNLGQVAADGTGVVGIYNDLQGGTEFAEFTVTAADVGKVLEIPVAPEAMHAINGEGFATQTGIGLHLMNQRNDAVNEGVRFTAGTMGENKTHQLVLDYCPPAAASRRAFGDFDNSGCTDIADFLFLLDYWQLLSPIGAPNIELNDFLALLDNWSTGPTCP